VATEILSVDPEVKGVAKANIPFELRDKISPPLVWSTNDAPVIFTPRAYPPKE
jgi:hypothetical protein